MLEDKEDRLNEGEAGLGGKMAVDEDKDVYDDYNDMGQYKMFGFSLGNTSWACL